MDSFAVVTCVPFPGTTAWQVCEKNGWFTPRAADYDNYWFEIFKVTPLIETPDLSSRDLARAIRWAYIRFYFLNATRLSRVVRMVVHKKMGGARTAALRWMRLLRSNSSVTPETRRPEPQELRCT